MTFHDLSEFSMTKVKQFFSRQYQNNHLLNILSSIIMHNMCLCIFLLKLKPVSDLSVIFSIFKTSFCQAYCFPWLSMTFTQIPWLSRLGNWNNKFLDFQGFPWPVQTLIYTNSWHFDGLSKKITVIMKVLEKSTKLWQQSPTVCSQSISCSHKRSLIGTQ